MAGAAPIGFLYEEEVRFLECYFLFVQNYLGERNLEWLERQAFDDHFDADEDVLDEPPMDFFLTFCEIVYAVDSNTRSNTTNLESIDHFLQLFESLYPRFSRNEPLQDALREIRIQIENRQTVLLHREQTESNSDSDSSSESVE